VATKLDQQIDELYQLPLDEFTTARNALAKGSGDAAIKKLEKPNLAAWAVNQLYWRERKLYDDVIKTAGQMRTAYKQMLAGKSADVRAAEVFHTEAIRKAKDAIRRILAEGGHKAADAIITPVSETLDALPAEDTPGRLTRPLRRTGFEALQGVTIAARPSPAKAAQGTAPSAKATAGKPSAHDQETERQRARREAEARELAMAKERLRFAEAAEREAEASLDRAKRAVDRAERTRERIERELDEAASVEKTARKELTAAESAYQKAQDERERLRHKAGG
jgi:hypothetical protein